MPVLDLVREIPQTAAGYYYQEQYKIYGNGINDNDVLLHLKSKHTGSGLSRRKKFENYSMAAARERIELFYAVIQQMLYFLSEKEKLMLENMLLRDTCFAFHCWSIVETGASIREL